MARAIHTTKKMQSSGWRHHTSLGTGYIYRLPRLPPSSLPSVARLLPCTYFYLFAQTRVVQFFGRGECHLWFSCWSNYWQNGISKGRILVLKAHFAPDFTPASDCVLWRNRFRFDVLAGWQHIFLQFSTIYLTHKSNSISNLTTKIYKNNNGDI